MNDPQLIDATCSHRKCPDETYELSGMCNNCGTMATIRRTKGHNALGTYKCSHCGCLEVKRRLPPAGGIDILSHCIPDTESTA